MPIAAVELELEFVTPCFLGGANRRERAEWRAASIRGQLRWWFRAVAGAHFQGQLEPVRLAEEKLFGSTQRASALRVRALGSPDAFPAGARSDYGRGLDEEQLAERWGDSPPSPATLRRLQLQRGQGNPIEYLGYGPILREGGASHFQHGRFEAKRKVSIELQWRRGLSETEQKLLFDALWCWLNLGGIGARSRRGFGSLRCLTSKGDPLFDAKRLCPKGRGALGKQLKEILPSPEEASPGTALPAWSHLSGQTRVYWSKEGDRKWEDAMMRVGGWLIAFRRRYGSSYHVDPRLDPSGSPRDYNWAAARKDPHRGQGIPDRAGFGLPLPFGQDGETVTWGSAGGDARRASPLLVHISCFDKPDGQEFLPVLTYIPAALVPPGKDLFLKGRPDQGAPPRPEQERIAGRFLDDLAAHGLIKEART